jgi:hypothetical protein
MCNNEVSSVPLTPKTLSIIISGNNNAIPERITKGVATYITAI